MKKVILILSLVLICATTQAQTTPIVSINIDSGAYVATTTGYSTNPFSYLSHGSYAVMVQDPINQYYTYAIFAGFAERPNYPKVSLIATRYANIIPWWGTRIYYQITIHHPNVAKWYGNHLPAGNGTFYATPTQGNSNGATHFSGEGAAILMCSSDSTDFIHVKITVTEGQKL